MQLLDGQAFHTAVLVNRLDFIEWAKGDPHTNFWLYKQRKRAHDIFMEAPSLLFAIYLLCICYVLTMQSASPAPLTT